MTGLRALVEAVREARAAKAASKQIFRPGLVAAVRDAEAELATAITPDVLAAVEAVERLGAARAAKRAAQDANYAAADAYYDARSAGTGDLAALLAESLRAGRAVVPAWDAWDEANSTMCELADRLAGESK